jgi:molybdate transport system ATP-binding protein
MICIDIEKNLKAYAGKRTLKVDRKFSIGSVTQIYGPSGSGKTTFLKCISGLITPEKGSIVVDEVLWFEPVAGVNLSPQKRRVGFVFQDYALFPNMTVQQHLEYATNDAEWIQRLLLIGRLETLTTHKPEYLSGGQQQRLAILRALAIKPKLLLMDEPFSALDPEMKSALIQELKVLFDEMGTTVLIVSHNSGELVGVVDGELAIG